MTDTLDALEADRSKLLEEFLLNPSRTPAALRKAQEDVAEFHRFQKLSEDPVSVNEKICALRPVETKIGGSTDQEKNAAAIHQEIAREVNQLLAGIFSQRRDGGGADLEAIESALRCCHLNGRFEDYWENRRAA